MDAPAIIEASTVPAPMAAIRFCMAYPTECYAPIFSVAQLRFTPELLAELQAVNGSINKAIKPREDAGQDTWTISPAHGDCDDYAVTKRHELINRGYSPKALSLAMVALPSGEDHLVLMVKTSAGDFVLDNLRGDVRQWHKTGYKFVKRQSSESAVIWVGIDYQLRLAGVK